jgi:phosphate transport system substrate-binding protein
MTGTTSANRGRTSNFNSFGASMKLHYSPRILLAVAALGLSLTAAAADISGAGATFPYPIYAKWADAYKTLTGVGLNYQSIGSGGGIKQIKAKTVTFGASDMPLKPEDLRAAGLVQFTWATSRSGMTPRSRA